VGSLSTLASTRLLHSVSVDSEATGTKKPFAGHASSQSTCAIVGARIPADEPVLAAVETLDVELLTGLDPVQLPQLGRQDDLALRGHGGLHAM